MEMPEESIVEMMHQVHEVERKKRDIFFKNAAKFIDEFLSGLTEKGVPEIETNRFRQQMLDLKIIRDAVEDVIPKVKDLVSVSLCMGFLNYICSAGGMKDLTKKILFELAAREIGNPFGDAPSNKKDDGQSPVDLQKAMEFVDNLIKATAKKTEEAGDIEGSTLQ